MSALRRLTPDDAEALYARNGMTPARSIYLSLNPIRPPCGCLVGVQLVDAVGLEAARQTDFEDPRAVAKIARQLGLDPQYEIGLEAGFCSDLTDLPDKWKMADEWKLGFLDGRAIRDRLFPTPS